MQMLRLEKEVRLTRGKRRRSNVSVIREHYLRDDIPCKVERCCICDQLSLSDQNLLSKDFSHYAIPDVSALSKYVEVFEQPGLTALVLLQTALTHIRSRVGRQSYRSAKSLLTSPNKRVVMFSNEHHFETFTERDRDETIEEWQHRLVYTAGVWYSNHLDVSDIKIPIVIITPDTKNYSRFNPELTEGLIVMSIEDYLMCYYPALEDTHALFQSLRESIESSEESRNNRVNYTTYLPENVIHEGLKKGMLYSGRLRVSSYHPRDEAFITPQSSESGGQRSIAGDIFIPGSVNRNRTIHGDLVVVELLPRSVWQSRNSALPSSEETQSKEESSGGESSENVLPTGRVVGMLEEANRRLFVASFNESSEGYRRKSEKVLVCPYDVRIPRVRISTRQAEDLRNHRIAIRIDSWEIDSQYPSGHFVYSIGPIGDLETETTVILIEHEVASTPFSRVLLKELPCIDEGPWEVDETEITEKGRRDLRHTHLIMSIDPKGCEDVDDALSIRFCKSGDLELGVHIADVSHFVKPGSLTDREAMERSTTVYLAERRYDMLPAILSANLCSLLSNVDRYAVSVLWRFDKFYQVKKVWYGRTVIRSRYKLAYETAQALFDGANYEEVLNEIPELCTASLSPADKESKVEELRAAIKSLMNLARILRKKRGGLELEGIEVRVEISDKDKTKVEDLIPKQPLEMHETIAECMIFANSWVAKKIQSSYPTKALLRRHPPPTPERFAPLVACANKRNFTIATQTNKALARSLDECVDHSDPQFNKILRYLATQAMVQAEYICTDSLSPEEYHHYGLDLDLYTHFTSPIRRYADLVVHRQLLAAVGDQSASPDMLPTSILLQEMARHMNRKHRCAQLAQLASVELFQGLYFAPNDDRKEERHKIDAIVMALRSNGVLAFSPRYGIRAPLYLRDKHGLVAQPDPASPDKVIFDSGTLSQSSQSITVTYARGEYTLGLFDHVRVHVTSKVSHAHGSSLSLHLSKCGPIPPPSPTVTSEGTQCDGGESPKRELIKVWKILLIK